MAVENLEYDTLLDKFKEVLKQNKLKYTKQREVIIETLYKYEKHFTPEELYLIVKDNYSDLNVGIATVYRTLNLLEDSEIATSISFGSQGKKFELAIKPHHDHMICKNCGKIIEFVDSTIEKQQVNIAKKYKFKLTNHLMQLYGICQDCQAKK